MVKPRINLETALNIANNSKSLWDLVKKINGTSQSKVIKVDVQALAAHFERILCRNTPIMQHHFALPFSTILEMYREIEVVEVTDTIARCKVRKAPGEDRVPAEFFKNASPLFISQLTTTFNKIFATANVPDSFRRCYSRAHSTVKDPVLIIETYTVFITADGSPR
ncbi:hypothetical protein ACLKA7_004901 [Drosophila subpalustris]